VKKPIWINHSLIKVLQEELIATHGGQPGIRDEGLLNAALNRPNQLFSYGNPDLFELATAYISGIIRNHPFLDGNKRTAFLAGVLFLENNGKYLIAPEAEATQAVLDLAVKKIKEHEFAVWLKKNCK